MEHQGIPTRSDEASSRILFLDYLRAMACLLVVVGHVYFLGLNGHEAITPYVPSITQNIFGADSALRNVLTTPSIYLTLWAGINVGALGVAIFFLISGFVILRTVERESPLEFLIRRAFRIYPVSLTAALFSGAVTSLYCFSSGVVSPHTWRSMLSSGFILNGFLHYFEATPVLWSLEVELFFYVLMAFLAWRRLLGYRSLICASLACMSFTLLANTTMVSSHFSVAANRVMTHLSFAALQITFLFIGAVLYRIVCNNRSIEGGMYLGVACAAFVAARFGYLSLHGDSGGVDTPDGVWALGIFVIALWSGMKWSWVRPLKWVGDISYPLYLTHVPLAWISLSWFQSRGLDMLQSSLTTGVFILFVAWITHITVEMQSQKVGRLVAAFIAQKLGINRTAIRPQQPSPYISDSEKVNTFHP